MKKRRLFNLFFICSLLSLSWQPITFAQGTGMFHIEEERIIDSEGNVFVPHGVNVNGPRWAWSNTNTPLDTKGYSIAEVWGFNSVRIVWRRYEDKPGQGTGFTIDEYIQEYVVKRGLVAMIDLQDYLGQNNFSSEWHQQTLDHWTEMAKKYGAGSSRSLDQLGLTDEQASRVWFNIHNEPISDNSSSNMSALKARYDAVIDAIRDLGAQNIIVLDGSTYANEYQEPTFNKTYGPHYRDNYDNIVMSVHYGKSDWSLSTWQSYLQWFIDNDIPIVGGEISQAAPGKDIRTTHGFYGDENSNWATGGFSYNGASYNVGVGGYYWHFYGGDSGELTNSSRGWHVNDEVNPTNLTEEGKIIWADIRRGDKAWAAPCGGDGCGDPPTPDTTPPTIPTNLAQTGTTNSSITVSWTASTDNRGPITYEVYLLDEFKNSTSSTSYSISSLTKNTQYEIKVRAKDGAGNYSAFSDSIIASTANESIIRAEAENAAQSDASCFSADVGSGGYSGDSYINYTCDNSEYLEFTIESASGGLTDITISYINGGTSDRYLDIVVNGSVAVDNFVANGNGDWNQWQQGTVNVNLNSGTNTVRLQATGSAAPHVDYIEYPDDGGDDVSVTGVAIDQGDQTLDEGQTVQLTVTVSPSDATDKSVTWASSDAGIATVNTDGLVTAVAAGTATITVSSNDNSLYSDNITVTVNDGGSEGDAFIEENGSVTIEAENYDTSVVSSGQEWQSVSDANASGSTAMQALPNNGVNVGDATTGPAMTYKVDFSTTGTYNVWIRTKGASGNDDSFHFGIDGNPISYGGYGIGDSFGNWVWANTITNTSTTLQVTINTAGVHEINIWMREDGVMVDKIHLSTGSTAPTGTGPAESPRGSVIPVSGVSIDQGDQTLDIGASVQLSATVSPSDATDQTVAWTSSDETTATVDNAGLVNAIAAGTATISVTTNDGGFSDNVSITVNSIENDTLIRLEAEDAILSDAACFSIDTYNNPSGGSYANYTCDNVEYLEFSVSVSSAGDKDITIGYGNGGSTDRYLDIYVNGSLAINNFVLSGNGSWSTWQQAVANVSLNSGANTVRLQVSGSSAAPHVDFIEFNTSGESIISVTGVTIDQGNQTLDEGASVHLSATVSPSDATDQTVAWTSSDDNIATVDNSGLVSAIAGGTATITVTTNDGGFTDAITVTVNTPSDLPWVEDFTLAGGTSSDDGETAWTIDASSITTGGYFEVRSNRLESNYTNSLVEWRSQAIDISKAGTVKISVDIDKAGSLENSGSSADQCIVAYSVDGGAEVDIFDNLGEFTAQTVSASGISGSSVVLIIRSFTSYSNEYMYFDNVSVEKESNDNITTTPTSISFAVDGGSSDVEITSNVDYTISADKSWITVSASSGVSGTSTITVTAASNSGGAARSGNVTISSGAASETVSVSQESNGGEPTGTFTVQGSKILDPAGNEFIPLGGNMNGYKWGWVNETNQHVNSFVNEWNFNAMRLNCYIKGYHRDAEYWEYGDFKGTWNINNDMDAIIKAYTDQGVVVMIDAHDWTGKGIDVVGQDLYDKDGDRIGDNSGETLENPFTDLGGKTTYSSQYEILVDFFSYFAEKYKDNPYVWLNPMNEPGTVRDGYYTASGSKTNVIPTYWKEMHKDFIADMRALGFNNPIVVDGIAAGQDHGRWWGDDDGLQPSSSAIISHGKEILDADPKGNVIFSFHVYYQMGLSNDVMVKYVDAVQNQGLALMIGEAGWYANKESSEEATAYKRIFSNNIITEKGVGMLVWHLQPGDGMALVDEGTFSKINDPVNPTNLTWMGEPFWDLMHGNGLGLDPTKSATLVNGFSASNMEELNVYPNPTKGVINIHAPQIQGKVNISVFNSLGAIVYNEQAVLNGSETYSINLDNLDKGVYHIHLNNTQDKVLFNKTIVVQ